jgi:hypothetical protein
MAHLQIPNVKVDRVADVGTSDMYVASRDCEILLEIRTTDCEKEEKREKMEK